MRLTVDERVTNRRADPSARITDRLPADTRIKPAPARRVWPLKVAALLGLAVVAWAAATTSGCLPRLEREDEPAPDAVRPVGLTEFLARAGRTAGAPDDLDAIEATVQQLLDNARAATGKRGISLPASVSAAKVTVAPVIDLAHCRGEVLIARDRVRVSHGHG